MQLNNKQTGEIIKISKIKDSATYYKVYENKHCLDNDLYAIDKSTDKRDTSYIPSIPMCEDNLNLYTSLLKVLEVETEFELSEDNQNWLVEDKNKTIFVLNDFLTTKMLTDIDFKGVIDRIIDKNNDPLLSKIIFKGLNTTIVYVNSVEEEDLPIVYPYIISGDLIIEDKIINMELSSNDSIISENLKLEIK